MFTYVLIIVMSSYGFNNSVSITEFKSKSACLYALETVKDYDKQSISFRMLNVPICAEVKSK